MFSAKRSHLHAIHGLSDLVQVVGGAERLQADVCQLELLLPQFVLQLQDDFSLGFGALAQPAIRDYTQGGGRGSPRRLCQHTHTHTVLSDKHTFRGKRRAEAQREAGVSEDILQR